MIDAWCSFTHYADWLWPIHAALPEHSRGDFCADDNTARHVAQRFGAIVERRLPAAMGRPCLVAGTGDFRYARGPIILVNHGAGQTYNADPRTCGDESFAGGRCRERVAVFIEPHAAAATLTAAAYPEACTVAAGPVPIDEWLRGERPNGSGGSVVAFTAHHRFHMIPEQAPCIDYFQAALTGLAADWTLLAHGHPRSDGYGRRRAELVGCEWVPNFADILDRADILIVDNSSAGPLFAATGRPVIWLSSPAYRRDVDHGGRFWDWTIDDPHVEDPADLAGTVATVAAAPARWPSPRLRDLFGVLADGHAAARAAEAIQQVFV